MVSIKADSRNNSDTDGATTSMARIAAVGRASRAAILTVWLYSIVVVGLAVTETVVSLEASR